MSMQPEIFRRIQHRPYRGGWVTITYNVRVTASISADSVGILRSATEPGVAVKNAARDIARILLPYTPYQEALIAHVAGEFQVQLSQHQAIATTGLKIERVDIEEVEGSKALSEQLQQSFSRLLEANDRIEIGKRFIELDEGHFRKTLLAEGGEKAIDYLAKRDSALIEAFLVSGKPFSEVVSVAGMAAVDAEQPYSLPKSVFDTALLRMGSKETQWPDLDIPEYESHDERLSWERKVVEERVGPHLLKDRQTADTFVFELLNGEDVHELQVIWYDKDKPPEVLLDGKYANDKYAFLSPRLYEYMDTTVWDIYWSTRKELGWVSDESADSS